MLFRYIFRSQVSTMHGFFNPGGYEQGLKRLFFDLERVQTNLGGLFFDLGRVQIDLGGLFFDLGRYKSTSEDYFLTSDDLKRGIMVILSEFTVPGKFPSPLL